MGDHRARRRVAAALLALVLPLVAAGCSEEEPAAGLTASPVEPPFDVAPTELSDTDGEPFSLADPRARLNLVFFGYTQCPDVCPAMMSTIASALTRLEDDQREQVDMLFVTTDPERDTAPVLRRYLDRYDPSYIGLTGSLEEVVTLARSVGVFVAGAEELESGGYDLGSHGAQVIGVDGSGKAPVFWRQDTSSAELAADIVRLLGE